MGDELTAQNSEGEVLIQVVPGHERAPGECEGEIDEGGQHQQDGDGPTISSRDRDAEEPAQWPHRVRGVVREMGRRPHRSNSGGDKALVASSSARPTAPIVRPVEGRDKIVGRGHARRLVDRGC